jgi:hypothetical protein
MDPLRTNVWEHQIPTPPSVILDQALSPHIDRMLSMVLSLVGLGDDAIRRFNRLAREKATLDRYDTIAYERDLKVGLRGQVGARPKEAAAIERAKIVHQEIAPFLFGDSLLDIGCGNGLISSLTTNRFAHIKLIDVVQYLSPALDLPFALYSEGLPLPIDQPFDTVLVLNVLHHSINPLELLKLAWGATRRKLIIIESVVGVNKEKPGAKYELLRSPIEHQIAYAAFVDWFYNRVLHDDIPVPYNFATPAQWESVFVQEEMPLEQTIYLGQDLDIAPVYHVLFVLEKKNQLYPNRLVP